MHQVRLCWVPGTTHDDDVLAYSDDWVPATDDAVRDLTTIALVANEIYGAGTHWLEERASPDSDPRRVDPSASPTVERP